VGSEKLKTVVNELATVGPEFFSVTYGAGGSTREKTLATVQAIAAAGHEAAPHLSCIGSTRENIAEILATYRAQGIRRLVALRGDLPSGTASAGEFRYASELIAFIRETQGKDWIIEVAAYPEYHPQQRYARRDLEHFAAKVKAGADAAITQFFFNPDAYFHFVDEVRRLGVTVPIVAGIMPFHNYAKVAQFAARDGIEIPRWVALKMEGFMDDAASIRAFGLDVVTRLCERLVEGGVPGIHFYTLNQSALALEICRRLQAAPAGRG
jgi:methylenetetrahydrofolate reductase (NADPH)